MHSVRMPIQLCPACGKILDAASAISGEKISPKVGDITICFGCATPLTFDENMDIVHIPAEDYAKPEMDEVKLYVIKLKSLIPLFN